MDIILSNNSESPIYEQIKEQLKTMILSGELAEGEALPSMRLLAKDLRISIITTKRAYEELEREGFIESYTGKGSFVRKINREMARESVMCEIEGLFDEILSKAELVGITKEELEETFRLLIEEGERNDG